MTKEIHSKTRQYDRLSKNLMAEFRERYGTVPSTKNAQYLLQVVYRLRIFAQATIDRIVKPNVAQTNFN